MLRQLFNLKFWVILLADIGLFTFSLYLSFLMRFDLLVPQEQLSVFYNSLPIFISTKLLLFYVFNLYRGMWRYTSIVDFISIIKATFASTILSAALLIFLYHGTGFPRTVFFTDFVFTVGLVSVSRVSIRIFYHLLRKNYTLISPFLYKRNYNHLKRLAIIGAGNAGEKILHQILNDKNPEYKVIGLFDDDRSKIGTFMHGISVVGAIMDLVKYKDYFDEIIICITSATSEQMRNIITICGETGKKYRTIPRISELINGTVSVKNVRELSIADLLGREEINNIDKSAISKLIDNKTVLITGAGGSIGSELVRQCLNFKPKKLILLDISEYNLFQIDRICCKISADTLIEPVLADIRNTESLEYIFNKHKPEIIFHAAAYKHVPIQEIQPWESVFTNIQGSRNLINISEKYQAETFVSVSTDKAVRPTNIMGATKRVVELLIQSLDSNGKTKFVAVRFGNVIGSSGSVIPIFQEQIKNGGPVTITNPDIERYFMSIPEAAQLILQAGAIGKSGNIYVLDMGKPHRIDKIARDLIILSGLEPEKDIAIEYTGLRLGEKMFEELIATDEVLMPTTHKKIMELQKNGSFNKNINLFINDLVQTAKSHDIETIKTKLMEFIS